MKKAGFRFSLFLTISLVLMVLNFTCARNAASDRAGAAMTAGMSVIASSLLCLVIAIIASVKASRTSESNRALGCVALIVWVATMYALLSFIWSRYSRLQ